METLFAWLHLADLHLCFEPVDRLSPPLVPAQALQEDISRLVQSTVKPDAVLVTGDLAANGRDYDDVEAWLRTLTPTLGLEAECALAVPGNHDVWSAADQDRSIARLLHKRKRRVFEVVRELLSAMCSGPGRCMYCEDNGAYQIEHFRPKMLYPGLVFAWANYLYACGQCNNLEGK